MKDNTKAVFLVKFQACDNPLDIKYFECLKSALECFLYYKWYYSKTRIQKLEIRAIYGLNLSDINTMENDELNRCVKYSELLRQYPRAKKLNDILPNVTPLKLVDAIGCTEKTAERILYEEEHFRKITFKNVNLICDYFLVSPYLFFE